MNPVMVCFGYPTTAQKERERTQRFHPGFIVFENQYQRLDRESFEAMFRDRQEQAFKDRENIEGATNFGQLTYLRKFDVDYARERNRSVREILKTWGDIR